MIVAIPEADMENQQVKDLIRSAMDNDATALAQIRSQFPEKAQLFELILKAVHGDRDSVGTIFTQFQDSLRGSIKKFRLQEADIDNIISGVGLELARHFSFKPDKIDFSCEYLGLYAWLRTIALKQCAQHFKKKQKRKEVPLESENGKSWEPSTSEGDPLSEIKIKLQAFQEFFRLLFLCGGYPHQQLAYALAKLLLGKISGRTLEGKPKDAQKKYGHIEIHFVIEKFETKYRTKLAMPTSHCDDWLGQSLFPIHQRSELRVTDLIIPLIPHLEPIREQVVNQTTLNQYCTGRDHGTNPFSDWCDKVIKNIRRTLGLPEKKNQIENQSSHLDIAEEIIPHLKKGKMQSYCSSHCKLKKIPPCCHNKS